MNILSFKTIHELKDHILLSALVVVEAVQALVVIAFFAGRIPVRSDLSAVVLPEWGHLLLPEREMLLYRIFIVLVIVGQAAGAWLLLRRSKGKKFFGRKGRAFILVETFLTALLLTASFKTIVYGPNHVLSHPAFYAVLILAVVNKMFFAQVYELLRGTYEFLTRVENFASLRKLADVVFPLFIVCLLFIPYPQAIVMRSFVGEQFHHNDSYVMGPGWAFLKGNVLDYDTISQYGLGMPVFLSMASKIFFSGFSYEGVIQVLIWACILYFLVVYRLLRLWIGNPWLVMAALMAGIKWQMFHPGVFPIVYTYGSATVTRYYFDIFFLLFVFLHIYRGHRWLLFAAGATAGIAIFHISSDGVYLAATYYAYLLIQLIVPRFRQKLFPDKRDWAFLPLYAIVPPLVTMTALWWLVGPKLFTAEFGHNLGEFIEYFISGFGLVPIYESLQNRYFLSNLMGFVMPLVYVLTLVIVGSLVYLKKIKDENLFVVVLCLYGLGIFHYYVARSSVTSYYAVCLPYVYILAFWIKTVLSRVRRPYAYAATAVIFIVSFYSLLTNHNFISYPNMFNASRNPVTDFRVAQRLPTGQLYFNHLFVQTPQELRFSANSLGQRDERFKFENEFNSDDMVVSYYSKESDFSVDAELIRKLTPRNAKVPVISSFEIKILMQADRAPFFYYFPLVISRPMDMRTFPVSSLYTVGHLTKTIGQLEGAKPPYIFMERIFLNREAPAQYFYNDPAFMEILKYVHTYYSEESVGKYLAAMKRKY
jgi:hypothetical protein